MPDRSSWDIIVIGAGPAGLMAALAAARAGRRVCILERKAAVGDDIRCGEGIGLRGFEATMPLRPEWTLAEIRHTRMVAPSGAEVIFPVGDPSYIIDRRTMERDLARDAVAAGAECRVGTPVAAITREDSGDYACAIPGDVCRAPCVILADGVESRCARDLGWNTRLTSPDIAVCAFTRITHPAITPDTLSLYWSSRIAPGGYAWVFPRGGREANVGLGVIGTRSEPGAAEQLIQHFIHTCFPHATAGRIRCGGAPLAPWIRPLVRGGAMLVGDAARQVNCVTGAGINYALRAGAWAGEIAAAAFVDGRLIERALDEYERRWHRTYGAQQRRSHALKTMLLRIDDPTLDRIAASLRGKKLDRLDYARVAMRVFAGHPWLMFQAMRLFRG